MSSSIAYLTSRANFVQISQEVPVTKSRNTDKYDQPDVFEGQARTFSHLLWLKRTAARSKPEGACDGSDCEGEADRILDPVAP